MAPKSDIRVTNVRETTSIDANGKPYPEIAVTFYVGDHGPFTRNFTKQGYDAMKARKEIQDYAAMIRTTVG